MDGVCAAPGSSTHEIDFLFPFLAELCSDENLTVDSRVFDEKNDFIRCNRNFPMGSDYLEDEE
jgi:hypothetical protein